MADWWGWGVTWEVQQSQRTELEFEGQLGLLRASLIAQLGKNLLAMQETLLLFLGGKICWRRDRLPSPGFLGFFYGSAGKESACNAGDPGLIPGLGRSPGEGKGSLLQYSWPGDFHGLYSPWGRKELGMTERPSLSLWDF